MRINPQIEQILQEFGIPREDGLAYLLSVYFDVRPSYTPPLLVQRINVTNILGIDSEKQLMWHHPLFDEQETVTKWDWIRDWVDLFGKVNKSRKGSISTCIVRMKAFFAQNPDVRKDEVIAATEMYLRNVTNPDYLITSYYFIYKDKGKDRTSPLEEWIEKYRIAHQNDENDTRVGIENTMQ